MEQDITWNQKFRNTKVEHDANLVVKPCSILNIILGKNFHSVPEREITISRLEETNFYVLRGGLIINTGIFTLISLAFHPDF